MALLKLRLGAGVASDIRARLAVYASDWTDGLHPRILPATVFIFTANLLPAIAFSSFMFSATNGEYGTTEVVLSTAICNLIWAVFAGQPMVIMGVTGGYRGERREKGARPSICGGWRLAELSDTLRALASYISL